MKRKIVLLLSIGLIFVGCSEKTPTTTTLSSDTKLITTTLGASTSTIGTKDDITSPITTAAATTTPKTTASSSTAATELTATPVTTTNTTPSTTALSTTQTDKLDKKEIVATLIENTKGDIDTPTEKIDIQFEGKTLIVKIDLSKINPEPLTIEDVALSRAESVTDTILDFEEFDESWNNIRIDFGKNGYIKADKTMIRKNEYGMRYFEFPFDPFVR